MIASAYAYAATSNVDRLNTAITSYLERHTIAGQTIERVLCDAALVAVAGLAVGLLVVALMKAVE